MAKNVRDAMTKEPRSIRRIRVGGRRRTTMREGHIGSLPITDNEKLV